MDNIDDIKKLFSGPVPVSVGKTKDGKLRLRATIIDQRPWKRLLCDILAITSSTVALLVGVPVLAYKFSEELEDWQTVSLMFAPVPLHYLIKFSAYDACKVRKVIDLTEDEISFRKNAFQTQTVDPSMKPNFFIEQHPKKERAANKIEHRKKLDTGWKKFLRWVPYTRKNYFEQCSILYLNHMGEPLKVAELIGDKYKVSVPGTLNKCLTIIEAQKGNGNTKSLTPQGDWDMDAGLLSGEE